MQTKNHLYHQLRFKLLIAALCVVLALGPGLFITRPAQAREAAAGDARPAYLAGDIKLSVVSMAPNQLNIFAVTSAGSIRTKSWNGTVWSGWSTIANPSGVSFSAVDVVSWGPNRMDIFAGESSSGSLWHKAYDGSWWPWEDLGDGGSSVYGVNANYGVNAVSWGSGRIDIFNSQMNQNCSAPNNCWGSPLFQKTWENGWWPSLEDWYPVDDHLPGSAFAVSHDVNRLNFFQREHLTGEGHVYHKRWDGSQWLPTSGWASMNGKSRNTPYAVSWGPNRLDVFVRGVNGAVYINSSSNGGSTWAGWSTLGGGSSDNFSAPSAVAYQANRLDIFEYSGGSIYHKAYDAGTWWPSKTGAWENMGTASGSPEVVSWGPGRIDVFVLSTTSGQLMHKWTSGFGWGPSQTTWEALGVVP